MGQERCYWRDIETLTDMFARQWVAREALLRASGVPMAMQPTGSPSVHSGAMSGLGLFAPDADVQIFTPALCAQGLAPGTAGRAFQGEWSKPPGTRFVSVYMVGAGGGGGSGGQQGGAGSGAGGNVTWGQFFAGDLPGEVPLYAPAGGAGGASVPSGTGNAGATQADCLFGSSSSAAPPSPLALLVAGSGGGGGGGSSTSSAGVAGVLSTSGGSVYGAPGIASASFGGQGISGIPNAPVSVVVTGGPNPAVIVLAFACGSGGSGGGTTTTPGGAASMPPTGSGSVTATGGGSAGSAGSNAVNSLVVALLGLTSYVLPAGKYGPNDRCFAPGGGGAGGGGNGSGAGGNGGNGYWGGSGGGGGGATTATGTGGNGGDAFIIVVSF